MELIVRDVIVCYSKWLDQKAFYSQVNSVKYLPKQHLLVFARENTYEFYRGDGLYHDRTDKKYEPDRNLWMTDEELSD